ncbi:S41 family peptidase [Herbidospora mongoliensis]|uniref:S41 family peptidase n=1 Tax=Herbidospora mongoliensis TaxID=688067 RepID=UPI00082C7090|nr:S41 family peptidase [Herbidospora mongoliensis]
MKRILAAAVAAAFLITPATPAAASVAPPACTRPTGPPPATAPPTSVDTLGQAYFCVFANYYGGPGLRSQDLLKDAFASYTRNLQKRGVDVAGLQLPELTGDRDADWAAAAGTLGAGDPVALRAAIEGMVAGLRDNHAHYEVPEPRREGGPVGTGIVGASGLSGPAIDPTARPPFFITDVVADSPAGRAGVRAGDIVQAIDGVPVWVGDTLNPLLITQVQQPSYTLRLKRPTTGKVRTVKLTEGPMSRPEPAVSVKDVSGARYVRLPGFYEGAADEVIAALRGGPKNVVLDLRGNGGGSPREVVKLLGAFAHGKVTSYFCKYDGSCTPNRTDDSVPLLGAKLVVLTDRRCASACEDFSGAVHDHGIAPTVGTRTAGAVSGPASPWLLNDDTAIFLPSVRHLGPKKEIIDTVGVPADHHAPTTALDLATGRDPALRKALSLLD